MFFSLIIYYQYIFEEKNYVSTAFSGLKLIVFTYILDEDIIVNLQL